MGVDGEKAGWGGGRHSFMLECSSCSWIFDFNPVVLCKESGLAQFDVPSVNSH